MPLIILHTSRAYKVMSGKVTAKYVCESNHSAYREGDQPAWYFAWLLGIGFAVLLAVLNGMWHEAQKDRETIARAAEDAASPIANARDERRYVAVSSSAVAAGVMRLATIM